MLCFSQFAWQRHFNCVAQTLIVEHGKVCSLQRRRNNWTAWGTMPFLQWNGRIHKDWRKLSKIPHLPMHFSGQENVSSLRKKMPSWYSKQAENSDWTCLSWFYVIGWAVALVFFHVRLSRTCSKSKDLIACASAFQAGLRQSLVRFLSKSCILVALKEWPLPCRPCSAQDKTWVWPLQIPCLTGSQFLQNWFALWCTHVLGMGNPCRQDACMQVCSSSQSLETLVQSRPTASIVACIY